MASESTGSHLFAGTYFRFFAMIALFWIADLILSDALIEGTVGTVIIVAIILTTLLYWICLIRQRSNDITSKHPLLLTVVAFSTPAFVLLPFLPSENHTNKYGSKPGSGISLV